MHKNNDKTTLAKLETAKTFIWASAICLLLGMVVMSPAGSVFLYALAVLATLIPIIIGNNRLRIAGVLILLVTLALLAVTYPKFDAEMNTYMQRAIESDSKTLSGETTDKEE